jgi:hypothetical protein
MKKVVSVVRGDEGEGVPPLPHELEQSGWLKQEKEMW